MDVIKEKSEGETVSPLVRDLVTAAEETRQKISQYDNQEIRERGEKAYRAFMKRMASLTPEERAFKDPLKLVEAINQKEELKDLPPLYTVNTRTTKPSGVGGKEARMVVVKIVPKASREKAYQEATRSGWAVAVGTNTWDTPEGNRYLPGLIYFFRKEEPKDKLRAVAKEEERIAEMTGKTPPPKKKRPEVPLSTGTSQRDHYREMFEDRRRAAVKARPSPKKKEE